MRILCKWRRISRKINSHCRYSQLLHKHFGQNHVCLTAWICRLRAVKLSASSGRAAPGKHFTTVHQWPGELSVQRTAGRKLELVDCSNKRALQQLRSNVGMIFQNFNLFRHLTVAENIILAPRPDELSDERKKRKSKLYGYYNGELADKFDEYPDQLSGGKTTSPLPRVRINPEILLCDEITSALDPQLVNEVLLVIEALAKEGMTIIMVTMKWPLPEKLAIKSCLCIAVKYMRWVARKCYLIIHRRLNSSASCRWYCNFGVDKNALQMAVFSLSLIRIASA